MSPKLEIDKFYWKIYDDGSGKQYLFKYLGFDNRTMRHKVEVLTRVQEYNIFYLEYLLVAEYKEPILKLYCYTDSAKIYYDTANNMYQYNEYYYNMCPGIRGNIIYAET